MAVADAAIDRSHNTSTAWVSRGAVWVVLALLVLVLPLQLENFHAQRWSLAVIYAMAALSLNVLIGYAGQISLGHQGFLGVGAFMSAYMVSAHGQTFWAGVVVAAAVTAMASLVMGLVALRVRGLYLALVTLVFGRMAQETLFNLKIFGKGAGVEAPRPEAFATDHAFYYLCLIALALVLYADWRFTKSKAGRAVTAVRENEQVAASYAIPVAQYKLLAFVLSGVFVGVAGALYAHRITRIEPQSLDFSLALFLIIVTVVGGLRSRTGVVVWTVGFTLLPEYLADTFGSNAPFISQAVGAALLVVILVFYPGGIGQLIRPVTRWLGGGPFKRDDEGGFVEEGVRGRP